MYGQLYPGSYDIRLYPSYGVPDYVYVPYITYWIIEPD